GLTGTANDANTSATPVCSVADRRRSAERSRIEETFYAEIARLAKPVLHVATRDDIGISLPRAQLRAASALVGTVGRGGAGVDCSATTVEQRERVASLKQDISGSHPSLNNFTDHTVAFEWQFVLKAHYKPLRPTVRRWSILLVHVVQVVNVRRVPTHIGEVFTPGVSPLKTKAAGELLADCRLQAVVVVYAIERVLLKTNCCETQIRHTRAGVLGCVIGDPVDRIRWAGEPSKIHIVAVVTDVDSTGSDIRQFEYIGSSHLVLNA